MTGLLSVPPKGRLAIAIVVNAGLLAFVGHKFWVTDWQYSLPTPRPDGMYQVPVGETPALPGPLADLRREHRPLLVHFANPRCPCTEFGLDHVRQLQKRFGAQVDFVTVLETRAQGAEAAKEFAAMHLEMPYVVDTGGSLSGALGVYGTPQAAILDGGGRLYFRGNYNRSRYCADAETEYVRLNLESLAQGRAPPVMPASATITYGCPLLRLPQSPNAEVPRQP